MVISLGHKFLAKELETEEQTVAEQSKGCDHFLPAKAILYSVVIKLVLNAPVSLIFRRINFQWGVALWDFWLASVIIIPLLWGQHSSVPRETAISQPGSG